MGGGAGASLPFIGGGTGSSLPFVGDGAILYPPWVIPYGIHGMEGGG